MRDDQQLRRTSELADSLERRLRTLTNQLTSITGRITTMSDRVGQLASIYLSAGQATVPALALGATTTVTVTLNPAMPAADYSAVATLSGGANLLSSVVIVGIVSRTPTTVGVTIRATGLLSSGAIVSVIAARHS